MEGSGSLPLTNSSGSGRPKNLQIRIRIRNPVHIKYIFVRLVSDFSSSQQSLVLDSTAAASAADGRYSGQDHLPGPGEGQGNPAPRDR
jgi:hypothetical protein